MVALMKVACSLLEVKPLSRDTFQCTPVYIEMYPCKGGIHGKCILWNSFDLRCESVTFVYVGVLYHNTSLLFKYVKMLSFVYCSRHGKVFRCPQCNEEIGDGTDKVTTLYYVLYYTLFLLSTNTIQYMCWL